LAPLSAPPGGLHLAAVKSLFRLGLAAHLSLVVLISAGAYAGFLPTSIPEVPYFDKLGHAILIGGLAFFLDGALGHRPLWPGLSFPRLGPVIVAAAAGIEEYLQRLSPRRSSDLGDFAADVVGICFFSWLSRRVVEARGRAASRSRS
jgi:polysaccharide biosynthesis protein VpsQ